MEIVLFDLSFIGVILHECEGDVASQAFPFRERKRRRARRVSRRHALDLHRLPDPQRGGRDRPDGTDVAHGKLTRGVDRSTGVTKFQRRASRRRTERRCRIRQSFLRAEHEMPGVASRRGFTG